MKIVRFAAMLMLAVVVSLSPVRAQDHGHHMMDHGAHGTAGEHHVSSPAPSKPVSHPEKCACCESGKCPMMKDGASPCKDGKCPMMKGMAHEGHDMAGMPMAETVWEKESAKAMAAMHENMAKPYTGDADADFIRGMIPHHEGAVDMARIVLKYGDDEQAKELARRIIVAQKGEIAWMQKWLRQRQIPETGPYDFNR